MMMMLSNKIFMVTTIKNSASDQRSPGGSAARLSMSCM